MQDGQTNEKIFTDSIHIYLWMSMTSSCKVKNKFKGLRTISLAIQFDILKV